MDIVGESLHLGHSLYPHAMSGFDANDIFPFVAIVVWEEKSFGGGGGGALENLSKESYF